MIRSDYIEDEIDEDVFLQDSLCPTIAEHATQCDSLFKKYMLMPDIVSDPTVVDDQLARFTLWASNMDVYGPLNVSLDYRLRFSPTVVEIIHQLLDVICDTLASLKPIDNPPHTPSRKRQRTSTYGDSDSTMRVGGSASESESEVDQAEENISKITDAIGGTVTRLFRLSNAIRKSAKSNRARKIERYQGDREVNNAIAELRLFTECYIRFRFPMAPDSLRLTLVEANSLRLRRLYYQRSHRRRISLSVQTPQPTPKTVQLSKNETAPVVRFASDIQAKSATVNKTSRPTGLPPVPVTNATTARQTAVGAFYAKSTTEVPRAKSILVNNKLSFPPLPPTNECPYCGVIIEYKGMAKSMLWHNHVIGDLEPFICVFGHCLEGVHHGTSPVTFETSKAWISHMQNVHGDTWECRAPSHDPIIFDREILYQQHSIQEHGVPEMHAGTLSSAARRPARHEVQECPFGDDFNSPEQVEPSAVFSSEALQSHIAAHMKEIALLTLQKVPNDTDESSENVDSDQPLEDEGLGLPNLRGSMYSMPDDEALDYQDDDDVTNGTLDYHEDDITPSVKRLDLEDRDDMGMTKLHHAVQTSNLHLTESLINEGANLGSRDHDGRTVLHYASMEKFPDIKMMRLLLNAGGKAIMHLRDDSGQTALHYAAENDFTDGIQLLMDYGVDTGITDNSGFSSFLWAVVAGQIRTTSQLLTAGADIDLTSANGKSALAWAAGLGLSSIAELLVSNGASVRGTQSTRFMPLNEAAASGHLDTVLQLLRLGADPNHRDSDGWAAIHWAAEEGHLEIVRMLFQSGADVDAVSSYGTSPLHCAANGGHISIVSFLLLQQADPLKSTCHGWTALHHAAFMGHSHVVQCLLEDGRIRSRASQQDNHGWSVLHLAIHSRDLATVDVLLASSIIEDPRAQFDESGLIAEEWLDLSPASRSYKVISNLAFDKSRCCRVVTGLRQAVIIANIPMIKLFLKLGHTVNDMNSGRMTALYYAAKKRMLPIIDILLDRGADPNILPVGRKTWGEFISDTEVLLRLTRAGYRNHDIDPEIERQIKLLLKEHGKTLASKQPASITPGNSFQPMPDSPNLPLQGRANPSIPTSSETLLSETPSRLLTPQPLHAHQTPENKRKAESSYWRSGTSFWKRFK